MTPAGAIRISSSSPVVVRKKMTGDDRSGSEFGPVKKTKNEENRIRVRRTPANQTDWKKARTGTVRTPRKQKEQMTGGKPQ
jgi:hypothetical protein